MAANFNLLDLPVDLLDLVLKYLLTSPDPICLCPCSSSLVNPLPVFLTHSALYSIALPLFYRQNTFVIDTTGLHNRHIKHLFENAASTVPARCPVLLNRDTLRRMARLEFRISQLRAWLSIEFVPILQDMIINGSLEHLTLRIHCPLKCQGVLHRKLPHHKRPDESALFTRPPLNGLIRTLADPYLRTARLQVDTDHPKAWCRFHSGPQCTGAEGNNKPGLSPDVVEFDWRALLALVDPERRDIAVAWAEDPALMRHS